MAGSWSSFVFLTGPVNQKLGRRWTGFWGVLVLCVGAALQAGAVHLSMMIVGRIIAGLGTSLVATAVPLYLSEIAPTSTRGAFGALNQIGIVSGSVEPFPLDSRTRRENFTNHLPQYQYCFLVRLRLQPLDRRQWRRPAVASQRCHAVHPGNHLLRMHGFLPRKVLSKALVLAIS